MNPSVPVNNMQELIAYAKANPGKLNYASVGIGSPGHIAGELLKLKTGIDIVHVPYKGGGPAVTDTLGGQVQLLFVSMPAALQYVKAGQAAARSPSPSDKRSVAAPDIPTIAEPGVRLRRQLVVRRARAGEDAAGRSSRSSTRRWSRCWRSPEIKEKLLAQGAEAASSTPAEFEALIKDELKKWEYVIREAKITPE